MYIWIGGEQHVAHVLSARFTMVLILGYTRELVLTMNWIENFVQE